MAEPIKPGWQTTEFWITLSGQAVAVLVVLGVIKPTDSASIGDSISKAVESVFALLISGATILSYVSGRVRLKDK